MTPVEQSTVVSRFAALDASVTDGFRVLIVGPAYNDGPTLNTTRANQLDVVTTTAEIAAIYATSTLSDPVTQLPFAAARALSPVVTTPVEVVMLATGGTAAADYATALAQAVGDQSIAWVVPLDTSSAVLAAVDAFIADVAALKRLVTPIVVLESTGYTVISSGSSTVADAGGGQGTVLTDGSATFVTDGVVAGDLVVLTGGDQALVLTVDAETQLTTATAVTAGADTYEVRRTQSAADRLTAYAGAAALLTDGYIAVWPPAVDWNDAAVAVPQLLAAAVGGQLGWSPTHQVPKNIALEAGWSSTLSTAAYAGAIDALPTLNGLWVLREASDGRLITRESQTNDLTADQEAYVAIVATREMVRRRIQSALDSATLTAESSADVLRQVRAIVDQTLSATKEATRLSDIGPAYNSYTIDSVAYNVGTPEQIDVEVTLVLSSGFRIYDVTVSATVV